MSDPTDSIHWNEQAEADCIAAAFRNRKAARRLVAELEPFDFFSPSHQRLFLEVRRLVGEDRDVDPLIVSERLSGSTWFAEKGGAAWVHSFMDMPAIATNVDEYARIVRELATRREIDRIANDLTAGKIDAPEASEALRGLSNGSRAGTGYELEPLDWPALIRDGVPEVEYLEAPYLPKGARVWIWGATGSFKSLWCLWTAARLSRRGVRVSYFSEENPLQEELRRLSLLRPDPQNFRIFHRTGMDLAIPEYVEALLRITRGDALSVFDSWTDLWSGDEQDNRAVQQFDALVMKRLQGQGNTPVVLHHTGHRYMFSNRKGATAGRGASALGQKADVTLEFKSGEEDTFTIVYGKCRIGGVRQPDRTFRVVDGDEALGIEPTSPLEERAIAELADRMVQAIAAASCGYLTTNEMRVAAGGRKEHQTAAMALLQTDPRVFSSVEKVRTQDGKRRDAKVWRSSRRGSVGERFSFDMDGESSGSTAPPYGGRERLPTSIPMPSNQSPDEGEHLGSSWDGEEESRRGPVPRKDRQSTDATILVAQSEEADWL